MKKAKVIALFSVLVMAAVISLALAACANPSGEGGKAVFTINLRGGGSGRMTYGPDPVGALFPR